MTKYIKFGIIAVCAFLFAGCVAGDFFDPSPEAIVMTGTDENPMIRFAVEEAPASYPVTVSATGPVSEDITVSIKIDNSLVEAYNEANKTSYFAIPDADLALEKDQVVIKKGSAASEVSLLKVLSDENFVDGRIYIIPVTITNVQGGNLPVLETSRTVFVRITRVYYFPALDISNYNMYSNYIFADDKAVELNTFTYEIKCRLDNWHETPEPISRLCAWAGKMEEKAHMLRFGENGRDLNSLEWSTPAGNFTTKMRFSLDTWYTISLVYDGSVGVMYVNGVKDIEVPGDLSTVFQRFELGMSWTDYPYKQRFLGRVSEIRVWDRAISPGEIQLGLCGVDPASEGLVAYWKMNEGEGHIFHDATGHGYDMDWSDTYRDSDGSGNVTIDHFDNSAYVEAGWVNDEKNRCEN